MSSEACVCVCVDERTAKQHRHEIRVYVQTIGVHVVTESAHTCKKPLLRLRETLFVCILYLNVLGVFLLCSAYQCISLILNGSGVVSGDLVVAVKLRLAATTRSTNMMQA